MLAYERERYRMRLARPGGREKERARKRQWKRDNREKANENWWRYHTRKLNAFVEDVNIDVLRRRDRSMCGICGKLVLCKGQIDHVIPISLGGMHSYANTQLSHPLCNLRKSNRVAP